MRPNRRMRSIRRWNAAGLLAVLIAILLGAGSFSPQLLWVDPVPASVPPASLYQARDSVRWTSDPDPASQACLKQFMWRAQTFEVEVSSDVSGQIPGVPEAYPGPACHALVRFLSPKARAHVPRDTVVLEWYAAKDSDGRIEDAPALIMVPESQPQMAISRMMAPQLAGRGIQVFLMQPPGYCLRREQGGFLDGKEFFSRIVQAVADARRARDAVAVLPHVQAGNISLLGTSIGGFAAELAAGLDHGFQHVFILLAGGHLYQILMGPGREPTLAREALERAGYGGSKLRQLAGAVEPLLLAHRVDPKSTWLYSARSDPIVPLKDARAWALAAHLPASHHLIVPGTHYTAILYFPTLMTRITDVILGETHEDDPQRPATAKHGAPACTSAALSPLAPAATDSHSGPSTDGMGSGGTTPSLH